MKNEEWDIMSKLAEASNSGLQELVSDIILNTDFSGMFLAQECAIKSFEVTLENVGEFPTAAKKLTSFSVGGFRNTFRRNLIEKRLNQIGNQR